MDTQNVTHIMKYFSAIKEMNYWYTHTSWDESKGIVLSGGKKKPISKCNHTFYDYIYNSFSMKKNCLDEKRVAKSRVWVVFDYKGEERGNFFLAMEQVCITFVVVVK